MSKYIKLCVNGFYIKNVEKSESKVTIKEYMEEYLDSPFIDYYLAEGHDYNEEVAHV